MMSELDRNDENEDGSSRDGNRGSNNKKEELIRELWDARQQLYRLYDIENSITNRWKVNDLIATYELFEEYNIASIVTGDNEKKEKEKEEDMMILASLHAIKDKINERIREANSKGQTRRKGYLAKQLDKVLTLIALTEAGNKEGINRLVATYKLLNRNDKRLLKALKDSNTDINNILQDIKNELEREIVELKKRLL